MDVSAFTGTYLEMFRGTWDRNPLGRRPFFRNSALPLAYMEWPYRSRGALICEKMAAVATTKHFETGSSHRRSS